MIGKYVWGVVGFGVLWDYPKEGESSIKARDDEDITISLRTRGVESTISTDAPDEIDADLNLESVDRDTDSLIRVDPAPRFDAEIRLERVDE